MKLSITRKDNKKSVRLKWLYLVLLTASFTSSYIAKIIWSSFINIASIDLGIKETQSGLFISAFYIGFLITQLPGGILADKFGIKYVLSVSLFVTGLFTLLLATINSYEVGLVYRVIAGLGSGPIIACCIKYITNTFKPNMQGRTMGIFFLTPAIGLLLSNTIGPLALKIGTWRTGFIWVGTGIIILSIVLFKILLKETPHKETNENLFRGLAKILKSRSIQLMSVVGFIHMWLMLTVATWANTYMISIGIEPSIASEIIRWYSFAGMLSTFLSGLFLDVFKINRLYFITSVYLGLVAITILFSIQSTVIGLTIVAVIFGFMLYIPNCHLPILVIQYTGYEYSGSSIGQTNFLWQTGALIAPTINGLIFERTNSFSSVWIILALLPILSIICLIVLRFTSNSTKIPNC